MFAKLRRRRFLSPPDVAVPPRPSAALPVPAPAPPSLVLIDNALLDRISRIRTALEEAGARLPAAPAPAWATDVRADTSAVPVDDERMEQISAYLGVPARYALTEEGCADIINQIEMLGVLKEMHAAGVVIHCARGGSFTNAAQLRAVFEHVRSWEGTHASGSSNL